MKITLEAWGKLHYDPTPGIGTLRAWAKTGQLHPAAEKVKRWMVDENAIRVEVNIEPPVHVSSRVVKLLKDR